MARKALLVGINRYPDPAHRLRGCVNDIRQMEALLRGPFGFPAGGISVLRDEDATTAAIRGELGRLTAAAGAGDVLVFHYSGHGSQVPDRNGDETTDRLDEILCPYDLDWDDPLSDDDLGRVARRLPAGAHLAVVLDCCHSGTGLREAGGGEHVPRRKSLPAPGDDAAARGASLHRFGEEAVAAGAVLVAGCRAGQTSADAFIDGAYHGAHTYFLCRTLAGRAFDATYPDVTRGLRRELRARGFPQVPQVEGSRRARAGRMFGGPVGRAAVQLASSRPSL